MNYSKTQFYFLYIMKICNEEKKNSFEISTPILM